MLRTGSSSHRRHIQSRFRKQTSVCSDRATLESDILSIDVSRAEPARSRVLTALPPAHELSTKLFGVGATILDNVIVPGTDVLFQFAEHQETAIFRPVRLSPVTLSTDENDSWINGIAGVFGLIHFVERKSQFAPVARPINAGDLGMRDTVQVPETTTMVNSRSNNNFKSQHILFVTRILLPLLSFFAAKLFHDLIVAVELGKHLLQLSADGVLVTSSHNQNAV